MNSKNLKILIIFFGFSLIGSIISLDSNHIINAKWRTISTYFAILCNTGTVIILFIQHKKNNKQLS